MAVPVVSGSHWLHSINRWYEFEELKARAMVAIAKKAMTGEVELGERFEIMVPDPLSRARYTEQVPMAVESAWHVLHHEPIEHAHKLTMPVRMFGVRDDSLVPFEQTPMFYERVLTEKHLESGNHWAVYGMALLWVAELTIDWFGRHLPAAR